MTYNTVYPCISNLFWCDVICTINVTANIAKKSSWLMMLYLLYVSWKGHNFQSQIYDVCAASLVLRKLVNHWNDIYHTCSLHKPWTKSVFYVPVSDLECDRCCCLLTKFYGRLLFTKTKVEHFPSQPDSLVNYWWGQGYSIQSIYRLSSCGGMYICHWEVTYTSYYHLLHLYHWNIMHGQTLFKLINLIPSNTVIKN